VLALQTLGAGDALGRSWLFPPYRWRFDASALELPRTKCDDDHRLGYEIVKRFAQVIIGRLQASQSHLMDA
jgi:CRP/FNR family transcriptional regulator, cyclic AMP receptor protein